MCTEGGGRGVWFGIGLGLYEGSRRHVWSLAKKFNLSSSPCVGGVAGVVFLGELGIDVETRGKSSCV